MEIPRVKKEIDTYFRITPEDVDIDIELEDKLSSIEKGLSERQLRALKS